METSFQLLLSRSGVLSLWRKGLGFWKLTVTSTQVCGMG